MQMLPTKARSCAHVWLADNVKRQINWEKIILRQNKLTLSQKNNKHLLSFSCLIIIILTKRQSNRQKVKTEGSNRNMNINICYLQAVSIDSPITETIGLSMVYDRDV